MALSEELKELYASSGTEVILSTLEINHNTFPEPIYIVNDWEDFTAKLENDGPEVTFLRYAFNLTPPSQDENGNTSLNLSIDNVSTEITQLFENAIDGNRVPISIKYRIYLNTDTTGPQNDPPIELFLYQANVSLSRVEGVAELINLVNRRFPNVNYGPVFQSLFYQE